MTTTQPSALPRRRRRAQRGSGEDLRTEIVVAAKRLLAAAGRVDDVSIRAVADAVGVTSPSIYLHFADKSALVDAVVVDVFRELDDAMLAAKPAGDSPLDRLFAYGMAYVQFAVAHPEHYRLATMDTDPCSEPGAVDEVLQSSAFRHFHDTVLECVAAGIFAPDDPLATTFDLWAAAHGVASLQVSKPYLPAGGTEAFATRVLCAAAAGHAVTALLGSDATPDALAGWLEQQRSTR